MSKLTDLLTKVPALEQTDVMYLVRPADGPAGDGKMVVQDVDNLLFVPHKTDFTNPHAVTAAQAGADLAGSATNVQNNLNTHKSDVLNPHAVTFVQAGADQAGAAATVQGNLDTHEADVANPHSVTAVQAGAELAGAAAAVEAKFDDIIGEISAISLISGSPTAVYTFDKTIVTSVNLLVLLRNTVSGNDALYTVDVVVSGVDVLIGESVTDNPAQGDLGHVLTGVIVSNDVTLRITANGANWEAVATRIHINL